MSGSRDSAFRLLAAGALVACGVPVVAGRPQQIDQQPTFRATAQTVSIYATVTDPTGRMVPDLTQDDFEVFDDNRPQPISVFDNGVQPITVAIMRDMSGSMLPARELTDAAMKRFIGSLIEGDRACYGVFAGSVLVNRKLTGDHNQLLQAMSMPVPAFRDGTALWDAVSIAMQPLYHQPGRRVILTMTDGGDNRSDTDLTKLETAIVRDEFMLYVVGLTSKPGAQEPPKDLRRAASVASDTGGGYFYIRPADDLVAAFQRISDELHHQYLLGFSPATLDGRTHKIDVRMKRADLKARARKSYIASDK